MPGRSHQINNGFISITPTISTGLADGTNTLHALPADIVRIAEWGLATEEAGTGTATIAMRVMRQDGVALSDTITYDLDGAVNSGYLGKGTTFNARQNQRVYLDMNFDAGSATGESFFHLWIRYTT